MSDIELRILVICLAPQIDARYEKLYAYLQDNLAKKSPSVELIQSLLGTNAAERLVLLAYFNDAAPLRKFSLATYQDHGSGAAASQNVLKVDARIVQHVLEIEVPDQRVRPYIQFMVPLPREGVVMRTHVYEQAHSVFDYILGPHVGTRPIPYLKGRKGVGKKTLMRALCTESGVMLAVVPVKRLLKKTDGFVETVRLILREGLLQPCVIYFELSEPPRSEAHQTDYLLDVLIQEIQQRGWLTVMGGPIPAPDYFHDHLDVVEIDIPAPDHDQQHLIWQLHLDGNITDAEVDALTAHFDLTGVQIARATRSATHLSRMRDPNASGIMLEDLQAACRKQSSPDLGKMARRIKPNYTWDDIVLPEEPLAMLKEICQWAKHRHKVLDEWGFGKKLSHGKGINALFAGPSGTGKTMAAEIIANELQVDLYKIDLSGIVSKYIGETEKNLDRIFTAAEHTNAILFFDEADALFGKRSEVKDSHDRYANIEVSYLLQKMELYEGIAILTTNLRQHLDEAFTRRLTFTVHFPFPDVESRLAIWQKIWPAEVPLAEDIDLDGLAREYKLSGGNIKNIALAAAFFGVKERNRVLSEDLGRAIHREYQKMGKSRM